MTDASFAAQPESTRLPAGMALNPASLAVEDLARLLGATVDECAKETPGAVSLSSSVFVGRVLPEPRLCGDL